jgi:hypothetical protein
MPDGTKQLALSEASVDGFEKCVEISVHTLRFKKCVVFSVANGQVTMELTIVIKETRYKFTELIDGDQCFSAPLLGFKVEACVSQWVIAQGHVSFTLTAYVTIGSFLKEKLYQENVTLPMSSTGEAAAIESVKISSPQELTPLLGLISSIQASGSGNPQSAAKGSCVCGGLTGSSPQTGEVPLDTRPMSSCHGPSGESTDPGLLK